MCGEVSYFFLFPKLNFFLLGGDFLTLCVDWVGAGLLICWIFRGSPFLKKWMEFLEEEADLRYPNVADLQGI